MGALESMHLKILKKILTKDFVPHLPPPLDQKLSIERQKIKDTSRAFSAFALHNIVGINKRTAAESVVDDFNDFGIDAIYYDALTETIYIIQSKLKSSEQFSQEEALAYCQGIRKLIKQDFTGFNDYIQRRSIDIEDSFEACTNIKLIVAYTGNGVSLHAKKVINDLIEDKDHGEERLNREVIVYGPKKILRDLLEAHAYERVDASLNIENSTKVESPRVTYFGLVKLEDLVVLHNKYADALYEKNIRTFLGHRTDVNTSIQDTLANCPQDFLYLNNGVTALCQLIEPKSTRNGAKKFKLKGFSVINGAQTIASSARFLASNTQGDISSAKVSLTLIKTDPDSSFGKSVTRARNHQNPVKLSNFAALDDGQERLRRELACLGVHYAYKAGDPAGTSNPKRISIDEAVQGLCLLQNDPRFVVWSKKDAALLLEVGSSQYESLFSPSLTALQLLNSVILSRYIQGRMITESYATTGPERLTYKHGNFAAAWILAKRVLKSINSDSKLDEVKVSSVLSAPFDNLRQRLWARTQLLITEMGPLALFRNQTHSIPLIQGVMIDHYNLGSDSTVDRKIAQQNPKDPYPISLFDYLVLKAPQIGDLT